MSYLIYFQEFFLNVKDLTRHITSGSPIKQFDIWTKIECELQQKLNTTKDVIHEALCGRW